LVEGGDDQKRRYGYGYARKMLTSKEVIATSILLLMVLVKENKVWLKEEMIKRGDMDTQGRR
jgi:hypothetical protein